MTPATPSRGPRDGRHVRWAAIGAVVVVVLGALVAAQTFGLIGPVSSAPSSQELEHMRAEFDGEIPDGSEAQRLAAQDGKIDRSDLLRLAENASNCSLMAGSRPISAEVGKAGLTTTIEWGQDDENVEELMAISDRCLDEHLGTAQRQYARQVATP